MSTKEATTTAVQGNGASPNGNPLHRLTPEQIEELGREFQAIHDDVYADLGEHDARYIRSMIQLQRRLAAISRAILIASRWSAAWALGTTGALGGEDPREHGDRPQRHARPVGLDERPQHPLVGLGLGHGLARVRVEALPQLRPPHLHEHRRQGQGRRLRDHARGSAAGLEPGLPASSRSTTCCWPASSSGGWPSTTSTSTRSARGKAQGAGASRSSRGSAARRAARSSRTTSPGRSISGLVMTAIEVGVIALFGPRSETGPPASGSGGAGAARG